MKPTFFLSPLRLRLLEKATNTFFSSAAAGAVEARVQARHRRPIHQAGGRGVVRPDPGHARGRRDGRGAQSHCGPRRRQILCRLFARRAGGHRCSPNDVETRPSWWRASVRHSLLSFPTGEEPEESDIDSPKVYEPMESFESLKERLNTFLSHYNESIRGTGMDMVFFQDAIVHLIKVLISKRTSGDFRI